MFSRLRDPISAISHLTAAGAAVVGILTLTRGQAHPPAWTAALIVYGVSLFLLFLASGVYHAVRATPRGLDILRKIDHAAIYLLIAGSYTPFCVIAFSGFWKWGFLILIWGLAVVGIVTKMFLINAPRWVSAGVYVVMGWLSVFAVGEIMRSLPADSIVWLVVGGVTYTAGAGIYVTRKMNFVPGVFGFHEVWHIFVVLGAAAHFAAIAGML